jgi:hypothetical protein
MVLTMVIWLDRRLKNANIRPVSGTLLRAELPRTSDENPEPRLSAQPESAWRGAAKAREIGSKTTVVGTVKKSGYFSATGVLP